MRSFCFFLALALLPCSVTPTLGQLDGPFTIAQIMSSPFPSGMVADDDGSKIAWVFNDQGVRNIWVSEVGSTTGRAVTSYSEDDGHAVGGLQFTADGQSIVYVYGSDANRRGEHPNPTSDPDGAERSIYLLDIASGTSAKLADGHSPALRPGAVSMAYISGGQVWTADLNGDAPNAKKLFTIRGSAGSLRWSPDGSRLAFVSQRGDHAFVGVYDVAAHAIRYLDPSVDRDGAPVWSPDGTQLAFIRQPNEKQRLPFMARRSGLPWSIVIATANGTSSRVLWTASEGPGSVFRGISAANNIFWSADGHIVFPWEGDGWTHLYSIPASGGQPKLLTPGDGEVQFVAMSSDGQQVLYSGNIGDINRQHIWRVPANGSTPAAQITRGNGVEWAPLQVGTQVYCIASSGTVSAHPAIVNRWGELQPLAKETMPDDFPSDLIAPPEAITFTATDGMEIHGQLFKPKDYTAGRQYPAILFFHGGSRRQMLLGFHHRGYYHNSFALNQYLASQGYLVLSVNYRSGIGYGMHFREALNYGARGASEYQDVVGAGLYMKSRPDVDGERIGLWGGSYGGYLTALGLARASDLFAVGVDIHGVHDWNVVINNFVPGYDPAKAAEVARLAFESSPMAHLDGWRSPVLLIHGDDDRNVPFSETVDLAESLRKRDVYFEQVIFPDEVHGFLLHRNWLAVFDATARFFDKFLKD